MSRRFLLGRLMPLLENSIIIMKPFVVEALNGLIKAILYGAANLSVASGGTMAIAFSDQRGRIISREVTASLVLGAPY